jgi:hypothetical protein
MILAQAQLSDRGTNGAAEAPWVEANRISLHCVKRWIITIRCGDRGPRNAEFKSGSGSLLVTNAYGKGSRGPLGIYNNSGDLGKAIFPAVVTLLLPILAWRSVVALSALVGIVVALALLQRPEPSLSTGLCTQFFE